MVPVLRLEGVYHRYGDGPKVLVDVNLDVWAGRPIALMGPSGSGKTTLLQVAGLLTRPSLGTVIVEGDPVPRKGSRRDELRRGRFSWVFQTVNVLGHRTVADNVALPLLARGASRLATRQPVGEALAAVGLANRANERAVNLSGGELQRVCIARAIAAQPRCILADEPTGQLDRSTSTQVLDALWAVLDSHTALVVATHDPVVAARCDDIATISDGRITVSGA